jgi:hypothetical protein
MSEKQDLGNREETPTPHLSQRVAGTRRKKAEESRDFSGAYNSFRGQAAENPRLSSYMFPRAVEIGRRLLPSFPHLAFQENFPTWKDLFTELPSM